MNESTSKLSIHRILGPRTLLIIRILALIALTIASYITWTSMNVDVDIIGCDAETGVGCGTVLESRWSKWLGIPVSFGGMIIYAGIFLATLLISKRPSRLFQSSLIFLTIMAAGSALWFTGLQIFEVQSYCVYCMTVHVCGLALAVLVFYRMLNDGSRQDNEKVIRATMIPARTAIVAILLGVVGVATLISGQLIATANISVSDEQLIVSTTNETNPSNSSEFTSTPASMIETLIPREVTFVKDSLTMTLGEYPILGRPDAEHIIGIMFDYTCSACRKMHEFLREAQSTFNNQFAIVMIPVPLDSKCNHYTKQKTSYSHRNACLFAKMALAVWNTKPEAFDEFDDLMFKPQYPPTADAARKLANRLVGKTEMDGAMVNPRVKQLVQFSLSLFYSPMFSKQAVPILLTSKQKIYGVPDSMEELQLLLVEQLGIQPGRQLVAASTNEDNKENSL